MKTDNHNDWTEAFRDSFPEEARPETGGWEAIAGRMRRAAARRRAAVAAAAIALPVAAGILFIPPLPDIKGSEVAVAPSPVIPSHDALVAETPAPSKSLPVPEQAFIAQTVPGLVAGTPSQDSRATVLPMDDIPTVETAPYVHEESPVILSEPGDLPDLFAEAGENPARESRFAIGIGGGATAGGTPTTATTATMASGFSTKAGNAAPNNFFNNTAGTFLQHQYVHDLPVSLGLTARYGLTDRLWLESGLEFTKMHSKLDNLHTVMHFAGIPLLVNYSLFSAGPFEAYAGIGGKAEKCLKATLGGMKVTERQIQWSGSILIGAQTRLTKKTWLYLQPDLTYYFTKTAMVSYRTENRLGLTVHAGLRLDISKP